MRMRVEYGVFMCNIGLGDMGKKEREKEKISKRNLGDAGFPMSAVQQMQKEESAIVIPALIFNRHLGVQRTAAIEISVRRYDMSANKRETMMEIEKARCVFRCGEPYF